MNPKSVHKNDQDNKSSKDNEPIEKIIGDRFTDELIIALSGPIGCGASRISKQLNEIFTAYGYKTEIIKITRIIPPSLKRKMKIKATYKNKANKIRNYQNLGDHIREVFGNASLAQLACTEIASRRENYLGEKYLSNNIRKSIRVVYIIDALKHPKEVELLKKIYRNAFYLVGIVTPYEICKKRMKKEKGLTECEYTELSTRDEDDKDNESGQKVVKTMKHSDIYIRNAEDSLDTLNAKLKRFVSIILSDGINTPTIDEVAMYHAYTASTRSGCYSRQVGAAIVKNREIIATGCNDVPKFGGGLYSIEDNQRDMRCYNFNRKCSSDFYKKNIYESVSSEIIDEMKLNSILDVDLKIKKILKQSRIKDLIEFSRAVHAEMDAIISLSRNTNNSCKDSNLYCTTYPCHSCACHIVTAGIKSVFYIQPYAKSLATELHSDSITTDEHENNKVKFLPYEGISPNKYLVHFAMSEERKKDGEEIVKDKKKLRPKSNLPLDVFYELELKTIKESYERGLLAEEDGVTL